MQRHIEELNVWKTDLLLLVFVYQIQKQGITSGVVGQGYTAVMISSNFAAETSNGKNKNKLCFSIKFNYT